MLENLLVRVRAGEIEELTAKAARDGGAVDNNDGSGVDRACVVVGGSREIHVRTRNTDRLPVAVGSGKLAMDFDAADPFYVCASGHGRGTDGSLALMSYSYVGSQSYIVKYCWSVARPPLSTQTRSQPSSR